MAPAPGSILAINGGSSSIKFAVYQAGSPLTPSLSGKLDRGRSHPVDGARQTPRASLTRSGFVEGEIVAASDGARDRGKRRRIALLAVPILQGADRQRERVIAKHLRKPSREISPPC